MTTVEDLMARIVATSADIASTPDLFKRLAFYVRLTNKGLEQSSSEFATIPRAGQSQGCGSPVVKVSDHDLYDMSSSPVPLKTRHVGQ
ncbi:hypothetical protein TNCV_5117601 [Trichonephila clavipes]|nr:hypothetical protein TNCV_5117601 [Trichonephila clavipes]